MNRKIVSWFLCLVAMLIQFDSIAQEKFTISGTVTDVGNGETMIGTNVYVEELKVGTTTNLYGFYSLTVPEGKYTLTVSYLGFEPFKKEIDLSKDLSINLELQPSSIQKDEVVITGEVKDKNATSTDMGTVEIPIQQVKDLPALGGEVDILKVIQLLPGVQSGSEGNAGLYVRGGGPDQNLVLLDEAVVYNASHLLGFLSVFNADAIKTMELTKGGMPAKYGGRLASVLDISMKEGNNKKFQIEGGLGAVSSRLTVQGPIVKDKASFILSGRFAYAGLLASVFVSPESNFAGSKYYFYDANGKVNYRINDKNRVFLSGYFGRDVFNFNNSDGGFAAGIDWGNATGSVRWNHLFNPKLFLNTTFVFSDYNFGFTAGQQEFDFSLRSGIQDYNLKLDLNWMPNVRHAVQFGGQYTYHIFTPSTATARSGDVEFDLGDPKFHAQEAAIYIQDEWDISKRFKINAGVRGSLFANTGPFDRYVLNELDQVVDTITYKPFENIKTYFGIEPRISGRAMLGENNSIKASYTMNYQYIHLTSLASVTLPTDFWVPSTDIVKPEVGHQWALGYFHNFFDDKLETSVEVYYKTMDNLVEYKEGVSPGDNVNSNPDHNFTFGSGRSYGAEFFIRKNGRKLNGWLGYTLAWTDRTFAELNEGKTFPATYDRRHDISVVGSYRLGKRWSVSAVFVYGTGQTATLPVARYIIDGNLVNEFGDRNWYRMPAYHRLDLGATLHAKPEKKFKSEWSFSIYNVYSRQNPYFIYFATEVDETTEEITIEARQVSLFPIMPSVTWNFKF